MGLPPLRPPRWPPPRMPPGRTRRSGGVIISRIGRAPTYESERETKSHVDPLTSPALAGPNPARMSDPDGR